MLISFTGIIDIVNYIVETNRPDKKKILNASAYS
jgi:hypothetical protein